MSKTNIPKDVQHEVWWKAAGRCEFKGCNKPLYVHGVTLDKCKISELAHIIGDSEQGPRGDKKLSKVLAAYSGRYPFTNSGDIRSLRW